MMNHMQPIMLTRNMTKYTSMIRVEELGEMPSVPPAIFVRKSVWRIGVPGDGGVFGSRHKFKGMSPGALK